MFLVFLRKVFSQALPGESDETNLSTQKWLKKQGVHSSDLQVQIIDDEKIESTEDYLSARGVDRSALITDELRRAEARHRLNSRKLVLLSLVVPMSIAPFWLMVLLSLPAFDKKPYSERMQVAFLAALVSDFAGLYYVITRDLFPRGEAARRNSSKDGADWDGEEDKDKG